MSSLIDNLPIFKNFVVVFLIMAISLSIFAGVFPKKAKAQLVTSDVPQWIGNVLTVIGEAISWAYDKVKSNFAAMSAAVDAWFKEHTLAKEAKDALWQTIRKRILNELANAILAWIRGDENGPNFITDWKGYLMGIVQQETQRFVNAKMMSLASCFNFNLSLNPYVNFLDNSISYSIQCPWQPFVLQNFYNDFKKGGWSAWEKLMSPSGNMAGQMMQSADDLAIAQANAYEAEKSKLIAGQSYKGTANTPGAFVSNAANKAGMWEWDYIMSQQEFIQFLSAVTDALVFRILKEGMSRVQTDGYVYEEANYQVPAEANSYSQSQGEMGYIQSLKSTLPEIKSELGKLLNEQKQNLSLMQQIKSAQDQMRAISTSTCSLASTFIGDELDSLQSAINVTNQKISQADQAITDNNALSQAIADFETAYNSGNTTTISSSANAYNLARQTALNSFSILIGSAQTGIANVYTAINSLLTNTVTEEGNYYSARGYGVYTGLSARLQSEKQALSKCQLSSGGSSSGGGI